MTKTKLRSILLALAVLTFLLCACGRSGELQLPQPKEEPVAAEPAPVAEEASVQNIPVGSGNEFAPDIESLELSSGEYDEETLLENLGGFTGLKTLSLHNTALSAEQLMSIAEQFPDIDFKYDFDALGTNYSSSDEILDYTAVTSQNLDEAAETLRKLPGVKSVKLTSAGGSNLLSMEELGVLQEAAPETAFDYRFTLYGQEISAADENVEYHDIQIGNLGVPEVENALRYMTVCKRFVLDRCGIDNTEMEKLRNEFPDTKLVWRIYYGKGHSCMTDTNRLRGKATQMLGGDKLDILKYCTDVEFLDFGHARVIDNIDFMAYMPKLKIAILSDTSISTLEPLKNCRNLQFIELCNCRNITDISPLAELPNLRFMNISNCDNLHDVTCMFGKESLERLYLPINKVDPEQCEALKDSLPNCWTTTERGPKAKGFSINYGVGWRLNSVDQNDITDWYLELRQIFQYDRAFYNDDYFIRNEPYMPELVVFK